MEVEAEGLSAGSVKGEQKKGEYHIRANRKGMQHKQHHREKKYTTTKTNEKLGTKPVIAVNPHTTIKIHVHQYQGISLSWPWKMFCYS